MTSKTQIRGQVARVLNERELAFNRGSMHGVEVGMRFAVGVEVSDIVDPETNEPIGSFRSEKVRVEVVEVQERLSVARTYETYTTGRRGSYTLFRLRKLFEGEDERKTQVRTLRPGDELTYAPIEPSESYIEVGDVIEEVSDIPEVE